MEPIKVVIRYADGRLVKGYTNDFFPNKPSFHVAEGAGDQGVEVSVKDLKAVFFVKDFNGRPEHNERKDFIKGKEPAGRKVEVTFVDGEVIVGATLGYDPVRSGFFVTPSDPQSNNMRVFVLSSAVKDFRFL